MITVTEFESDFAKFLPETYELLRKANLVVHSAVLKVTLHGSRGLSAGYKDDSDINLCLLVDTEQLSKVRWEEDLLKDIINTTLSGWKSSVKLDLAAIFDLKNCSLKCFNEREYKEEVCKCGGVDCFGLYKEQKGLYEYVFRAGIHIKSMYPCIIIWRRPRYL